MNTSSIYGVLRTVHIGCAFLGLVVFWLPLLVRKGGRMHVVCGRIFVVCATVALATAFVVSGWRIVDPIHLFPAEMHPPSGQEAEFVHWVRLLYAFLAALSFYTFVALTLAVQVVRTRQNPERLNGFAYRLLLWSQVGIGLGLIAFTLAFWFRKPSEMLYAIPVITGLAGVASAWWDLRFIAKLRTSAMSWWYKHMEFMLRTGIAFHTAFAVFIVTPWLGRLNQGSWALVPWVLPGVVGLPLIWLWVRHYRREFGDLPTTTSADRGIRSSNANQRQKPAA